MGPCLGGGRVGACRVPQIRMKDLVEILKAVPEEEVRRKREAVLAVRRRFNWQGAVQKVYGGKNQARRRAPPRAGLL